MMEAGEVIVALASIGGLSAVCYPITRAFGRRLEGRKPMPAVSPANDPRLERMEQSLDAIAVEIERITEAQRFTTRLLSERGQLAGQNGSGDPGADAARRSGR